MGRREGSKGMGARGRGCQVCTGQIGRCVCSTQDDGSRVRAGAVARDAGTECVVAPAERQDLQEAAARGIHSNVLDVYVECLDRRRWCGKLWQIHGSDRQVSCTSWRFCSQSRAAAQGFPHHQQQQPGSGAATQRLVMIFRESVILVWCSASASQQRSVLLPWCQAIGRFFLQDSLHRTRGGVNVGLQALGTLSQDSAPVGSGY